jgi:hydrogenase-4 component B
MTHIGTVFIILAFFMLYKATGSFYFSDYYGYNFDNKTLYVILVLSFIGFGIKAGMFPLHVWLPKAHPAAPTNVSSLMSGVMIKMGIYGIIRVCFDFPQTYILSFGFVLLAVGVLSAVIGITHALIQSDLKKFLAYSSIENIGIIILALGISYICYSMDLNEAGSIALCAAFIHVFNHGIFKTMLFMGAGNVLHSTGTRNIEEMGGLIKRMPKTSCFFLIGALSACALPPFNGFIGEWFIYKSVIQAASQFNSLLLSVPVILSGIALAFTGALAAYGFVKVFGIAFLGLPRSEEVNNAVEVPYSMTVPMGILGLACLIIGIYPNMLMGFLRNITSGVNQGSPVIYNSLIIAISNTGLSMILAALCAGIITLAVICSIRYKNKKYKARIYGTWDCGYDGLNSRMQFSGQGYIKSFNRLLSGTFVVNKTVEYTKGHLTSDGIKFDIDISDNVEKSIYTPVRQLVRIVTKKAQKLQHGFIQAYLAYVFIVLILLMIFYL